MKRDYVIAHYREDLSWIDLLGEGRVLIYEKGGGQVGVPLENVGREAHTWLYHIVHNYDRMADVTVFLQGYPSDHVGEIEKLNESLDQFEETIGFFDLGHTPLVEDRIGFPNHAGLPLEAAFKRLFREPAPEFFTYRAGANFAVSRETIRQRPRSFYVRAMQVALEPEGPWILERFWPIVFAPKKRLEGIVTATDAASFQDFSFFLESLARFDTPPLDIVDLGMNDRQRTWCKRFSNCTIRSMPPLTNKLDRIRRTKMWQTWLKPFYLLSSNFDRCLWLDADCFILRNPSSLFERLKVAPLLVRDATGANVANRNALKEHFPHKQPPDPGEVTINAGVLGFDRYSDRDLLATWAWAVQWVAHNLRFRNLFRWYDQGALIWSLQHLGMEEAVSGDISWNHPFEPRDKNPFEAILVSGESLSDYLTEMLPQAQIVHFFGDYKLSEKLRRVVRI